MRVRVTTPVPREVPFDAASSESAAVDANWQTADDQALVDASLDGRPGAFDVIVERYRRQVYQLCYRFVGNHEDASDLAQDVFIRAYRGLRGFRSRVRAGHVAVPHRGERQPQSDGGEDAANRGARSIESIGTRRLCCPTRRSSVLNEPEKCGPPSRGSRENSGRR